MNNLLILAIATVIFTLPLIVWRLLFEDSGFAGLPLLALGLLILSGTVSQRLSLNRARLAVALRPETWLRGVLTGMVGAVFTGLGLLFIALPVLAWTALSAGRPEQLALSALCIASGGTCVFSGRWVAAHFQPAYVRSYTVFTGTLAPVAVFLPIMIWINWTMVEYPVDYAQMGFLEALQYGLDRGPRLSGPDAAVMRFFQSADSLKLWLVHRFEDSALPGLLFSLHSALVVVIFARCFVAVTDFLRHMTRGTP
ncbi:MAG: hypothetical protein EA353_05010 [Puniceicoccaceae bacterium]|nr:MAG: hypothetical protein EA353_05010 [Puniceicoccaceae bacterium]